MPIDTSPGGTDIEDRSGNGKGADINSDDDFLFITDDGLDNVGRVYLVNGIQVVGPQQAAISDGLTDSQKIAAILAVLRNHGIIDT
jgi:hypothetical protein